MLKGRVIGVITWLRSSSASDRRRAKPSVSPASPGAGAASRNSSTELAAARSKKTSEPSSAPVAKSSLSPAPYRSRSAASALAANSCSLKLRATFSSAGFLSWRTTPVAPSALR